MATPKVTILKVTVRGKAQWAVSRREGGKRRRTFHSSKSGAEAEAARLRAEIASAGASWIQLPAAEKTRLMALWREAVNAGVDLQELFDQWKQGPRNTGTKALEDAITELVAAKRNAGRSERYIETLELLLNQFAKGRERIPIDQITTADTEAHLDAKQLASRPTLRARLSTLFRFAIRRGYRHDNPCDKLESVTLPPASPQVFTVMQFARCLVWLIRRPRPLAWFVLTAQCGLRPEEAEQTTWGDINFVEQWIRVEGQTTKVRQRRIVHPKPEAMAWLKFAKDAGAKLPLSPATRRNTVRALRQVLRFKHWPKDITRHTAASYWLADKPDAAYIAEQLGHSEQVLKRDYKALITREQAKRFWTIKPKEKAGKIGQVGNG